MMPAAAAGSLATVDLFVSDATQQQWFQTAMKHLQPVTSMLSALTPARFRRALLWLAKIDDNCRSGAWEGVAMSTDVEQLLERLKETVSEVNKSMQDSMFNDTDNESTWAQLASRQVDKKLEQMTGEVKK